MPKVDAHLGFCHACTVHSCSLELVCCSAGRRAGLRLSCTPSTPPKEGVDRGLLPHCSLQVCVRFMRQVAKAISAG